MIGWSEIITAAAATKFSVNEDGVRACTNHATEPAGPDGEKAS